MSFFSWFKSAPKLADDVMDKDNGLIAQVGNWVGNMHLTKEEVMESNTKLVTSVHAFVASTLSENTERSKSRREFTKLWVRMHVTLIMLGAVCVPIDAFAGTNMANTYFSIAMSPYIAGITGAISVFFYGSQGLARYHEAKALKKD